MSEYEHLKQEREKLLNKKLRRNDTRYTVYVAILFFTVMVAFEAMRLAYVAQYHTRMPRPGNNQNYNIPDSVAVIRDKNLDHFLDSAIKDAIKTGRLRKL